MARLLTEADYRTWFDAFLPSLSEGRPAALLSPVFVSDRSDGKIAHLDGLNLSRAWCWREIASRLGDDHSGSRLMRAAAEDHFAFPHIAGDYMGEHWLVTFALMAMEARRP